MNGPVETFRACQPAVLRYTACRRSPSSATAFADRSAMSAVPIFASSDGFNSSVRMSCERERPQGPGKVLQ